MISKIYLIYLFQPMLAEGVDVDEGMDVNEGSSKTDFDAVKTYIKTVIIKQNKVVSMFYRLCTVTTAVTSVIVIS